jgi:hypothetical protein
MNVEVDSMGRRLAINRPLIQQEDMLWSFQLFDPFISPSSGLYQPSVARPDLRRNLQSNGFPSVPGLGGCGSCAQAPCSSWVSYMHRAAIADPRGPVYTSRSGIPDYPPYKPEGRFLYPYGYNK